VANILVQIELKGGKPDSDSLGLINEARVIASRLGATLYAMLPCDTPPSYGDNDVIAILSRHGADKVILLTHEDLGGEVTPEQKAVTIRLACERFPPRLLMLPSREENLELAAGLAIHLQGQYTAMERLGFSEADRTPTPEEEINRDDPTGELPEGVRLIQECAGPLVLTLLPDAPPIHMGGDEEAEVVVLHPEF
jgi:hypothetical protein